MSDYKNELEVEATNVAIFGENFKVYGNINEPLFLGVDIAEMIEYDVDKTHQMLNLVDDDEKLTDTINRSGQNREMWFVTEFGLYELLMQSRKPLAKRFKLVIKNILKQIRMGTYIPPRRVSRNGHDGYTFYNAKIIFRDFSGEKDLNRQGRRSFSIIIDEEELANSLKRDGWNIKPLKSRDEEEEQKYFLPVAVRYDNIPPRIYKKSGDIITLLDEEAVGSLDYDEFSNVDVTVTPSNWDVNGNQGIKAYVKTMIVTLVEDELITRYIEEKPFN